MTDPEAKSGSWWATLPGILTALAAAAQGPPIPGGITRAPESGMPMKSPAGNGQSVQFDRIVSVDVQQPWDGRVTLTLTNGQQLAATTGSYTLTGTNELGRYMGSMPDIRRIDFLR